MPWPTGVFLVASSTNLVALAVTAAITGDHRLWLIAILMAVAAVVAARTGTHVDPR